MNIDLDTRLPVTANDLEWEVLHILLYISIAVLASNQSLDIEDRSFWVASELILCGVSDEAFIIGECDPGRCDSVTLIVGEDFDCKQAKLAFDSQLRYQRELTFAVLHDTNTRVCGSQINTDNWSRDGIIL